MNATRILFRSLLLAVLSMTGAASLIAQTTLYMDSFGGGAVPLNGVLVQGGTLQTGAVAWSANSAFQANGNILGADEGSAVLPLSLQVNSTYTLSMDVTNATDRWVGLGFKNSNIANAGASDTNSRFSNGGGISWMLYRDHLTDQTQDIQIFGGLNTANPIADDNSLFNNAGTNTLKIVLDTTGAGGTFTADFQLNGVSVSSGPQLVNQPISAIQYVGLTFDNATTDTGIFYDNFLLTQTITGPTVNQWNIDGGGVFGTAGNWTLGAPATGSTVQFGPVLTAPNSPATVTLNAAATLGEVQFSNAAATYVLAGPSTLTLSGAHTLNGAAGTHEVTAVIAGSAGLVKSGGGTIYLSANNTYTGLTDVQAGSLRLRNVGAVDGAAAVASGASLYFSGDAAATGAGFNGTFTPDISGAGEVHVGPMMTTETVTFSAAKTYTGATVIEGGTLALSGAGTLGASDGTAASRTQVTGNQATGKLSLGGVSISNEMLLLNARELTALNAPHVVSTGTSSWGGNIKGDAGGTNYNITSNSGTLNLGGVLSAPAANPRNFVFDGAGNVNVTGKITDIESDANGAIPAIPTNANNNVNVVKRGAGTLTIRTATNNNDDYWLGDTTVEGGTLEVISDGANNGELKSASITVRAGSTLDVDHFTTYSLQPAQRLGGGGTILATGKTVEIYDDNSLSPGDNGVGTLTINGNASLIGGFPAGTLNYDLGDTTVVGGTANDLVQINGSLSASGNPTMPVNVTPVKADLAAGTYRLMAYTGAAITGTFTPSVVSNTGAVLNPRQTLSVSSAANQLNLVVTGNEAALTWNGASGNNAWDVNVSTNWTGADGKFRDLDDVTFGAGGIKNVVVNTAVSPGLTNFNGGVGTTYSVTGTGGLTGYGAVNVNSGTVKLLNSVNNYRGSTTVATGARLEMASAQTGGAVVNGTLAVKSNLVTSFTETFDGNLAAYSNTRILDANGGASNVYQWEIASGALQINTTTYDGIEQTALTRTDQTLDVGEEIRAKYLTGTAGTQDIGLYIGNGTPTADVRQNYVSVYIRNNGQVFSRGFNGTTEFALAGGATPAAIDSIFVRRTSADTFETGYYENGVRNVVTTRTIENANAAGIGNAIGFYSDVRNAGIRGFLDDVTISSGSASNRMTVNGDLTVAASGGLEFDVSSLGFTSLAVTGVATFASGATISLNLLDGFLPVEGANYALLAATGGITAPSLTFNLPALGGGLAWDTSAFGASGVLSVIAAGLAGDFNADNKVDGADFLAWQRNPGVGDLNAWRTNYGATAASPAVGAVPEPATLVLAGLAASGMLLGRRSRK